MADGGAAPDVRAAESESRAFSGSLAVFDGEGYGGRSDSHGGSRRMLDAPSSSRQAEKRNAPGSSNFIDVLKERVQAVLDAQHQSSAAAAARVSSIGSVGQPTASTDPVSRSPASPQSANVTPQSPSSHPEVRMLPFRTGPERVVVDSDGELRPARLQDYYSIDWRPKELFLKFRQQVEGFQLGANVEFDGFRVNEYNTKLVLKPLTPERKWKFIFEPRYGDLRLLTKKIRLGPLLNIQVGIGHEWQTRTTGWKWKVTSVFGGHTQTHIRHKTLFPLTPGFDLRVGWNAEYFLPDLHGSLGTGDPAIGLNLGHLFASVERLEAIYTHRT